MHIERLSFDRTGYDGLEAAIHIARYSFVRRDCEGKRVLDIACGEGYGSSLMAEWGAREVHGVDISMDAIVHAQKYFSTPHVSFHRHDAESIDSLFEPHSFDLIVSFETIEHVADQEAFLLAVKRLLKPGGKLVVSCPNDWWYYPTADQSNPFHLRKYHFADFKSASESVLGNAAGWFFGGPIFGFGNVPAFSYLEATVDSSQILMQKARNSDSFALPAELSSGPRETNASYFIGVWCPPNELGEGYTSAYMPMSMDAFRGGMFQGHIRDFETLQRKLADSDVELAQKSERLEELHQRILELEQQVRESKQATASEIRKVKLRNQALIAENDLIREGSANLQRERSELMSTVTKLENAVAELGAQNARLEVVANRYYRLRNIIPSKLRGFVLLTVRTLRRIRHG